MTGWVWGGIIIGIVIVALAVGIPSMLTHRRMHPPHDLSEGQDYVQAKRRWLRRRRRGTATSQPR
ncbi:MAG: hypothetical protein JO037_10805 [Actinobacteria bacterium]|nr:hypothetical protein [Actinomycetota bacterium]